MNEKWNEWRKQASAPPLEMVPINNPMWHGWDTENEVAYRSDAAGRLRDVGVIQYPDPYHDDDPVYAVFSDGEKVVLHELSVGEHKAILEIQEKKTLHKSIGDAKSGVLW